MIFDALKIPARGVELLTNGERPLSISGGANTPPPTVQLEE